MDVTLDGGAERRFDLVVGADGLHSNARRLAFGPEEKFVRPLGYGREILAEAYRDDDGWEGLRSAEWRLIAASICE